MTASGPGGSSSHTANWNNAGDAYNTATQGYVSNGSTLSKVSSGIVSYRYIWSSPDSEPPSRSVVVKRTASAGWVHPNIGGSGSATTNVPGATNPTPKSLYAEEVYIADGSSGVIEVPVYISVNSAGSGSSQSGSWGSVQVSWSSSVSVTPVVVDLAGTIDYNLAASPGAGKRNCLIGQYVRSSVTAGTYTLTGHSWTTGNDACKGVTYGAQGTGVGGINYAYRRLVWPTSADLLTPTQTFFFNKPVSQKISVSVTVMNGSTVVGTATAERMLAVDVPDTIFNRSLGIQDFLPDRSSGADQFSAGNVNKAGAEFDQEHDTPARFLTQGNPGECFVQFVDLLYWKRAYTGWTTSTTSQPHSLDSTWPYSEGLRTSDTPMIGLVWGTVEVGSETLFQMHSVYVPPTVSSLPPSERVSVRWRHWMWNGIGLRGGPFASWPAPGGTGITAGGQGDYDAESMEWEHVLVLQP